MSNTVQTMDRLNALSAIVQLASFRHLPGPSQVTLQTAEHAILSITTDSHEAARAWCDEFGTGWYQGPGDEIWSSRSAEWRGWMVQVHSLTEQS
jgi:hypothetical protein